MLIHRGDDTLHCRLLTMRPYVSVDGLKNERRTGARPNMTALYQYSGEFDPGRFGLGGVLGRNDPGLKRLAFAGQQPVSRDIEFPYDGLQIVRRGLAFRQLSRRRRRSTPSAPWTNRWLAAPRAIAAAPWPRYGLVRSPTGTGARSPQPPTHDAAHSAGLPTAPQSAAEPAGTPCLQLSPPTKVEHVDPG